MVTNTMDLVGVVRKHLESAEPDALREMVTRVAELLMSNLNRVSDPTSWPWRGAAGT